MKKIKKQFSKKRFSYYMKKAFEHGKHDLWYSSFEKYLTETWKKLK